MPGATCRSVNVGPWAGAAGARGASAAAAVQAANLVRGGDHPVPLRPARCGISAPSNSETRLELQPRLVAVGSHAEHPIECDSAMRHHDSDARPERVARPRSLLSGEEVGAAELEAGSETESERKRAQV